MKFCIVTPWYKTSQSGGAETLARLYAEALTDAGHDVWVASTTAQGPHHDWDATFFSPGESSLNTPQGNTYPLFRFATNPRRRGFYDGVNARILNELTVTLEDEMEWVRHSIASEELLNWLRREAEDRILLVLPYPFGLSYKTCFAFGSRCILVPCLHHEGYAALSVTSEMMQEAGGLLFNTPEESELADRLIPELKQPRLVTGPGLPAAEQPDEFDAKVWRQQRLNGRPFIFYLGWRDVTKGLDFLLYCHQGACQLAHEQGWPIPMLAIAGPEGTGLPPGFSSEDVVDLGFLPAAEKRLALSACEWLVQPSQLESYSLVMMEAWQQERPCLVHALCPVTRGHVDRVGGGLYFANDAELAAVLQWGMVNPGLMRKMGRLGKQYVSNEATWDKIIPQVEQLAEQVAERAGLVEMAVV